MESKYYFVSYRWRNVRRDLSEWQYSNALVDKHPLLWLKESNQYSDETYNIEFYEEIAKELYDEVYGWVN